VPGIKIFSRKMKHNSCDYAQAPYPDMVVYYCGKFLEKSSVIISPDDRGFLFADGIYEVVRAYKGRLFKLTEHLERLVFGLKELRIQGVEIARLREIIHMLLGANQLENADATIYIQITRGAAPRNHKFPPTGTPPTIYMEAKPFSSPVNEQQNGASAIVVPDQRWARCDIKSISLLPNTLAFQTAAEAGAFEAIFSRDGVLLEGSRSSILFVRNGALIFPPLTNYVLGSITRNVVLELAVAQSIPTASESFYEKDLFGCEEVIMAGTTAEVTPITTVNGNPIGNGKPGPMARKLQEAFWKASQSS
jgi:D-alanine transaminase